jgi:signal recognition particle subunit SEC65
MAHVFISYVRENQNAVDRLAMALRRAGIDVWLDREQIKPGERWQSAIKRAIKDGAYFIACFSQAYGSRMKSYMNEELTLAIKELRQHPIDRTWFIPVLFDKCDVPERPIGGGETLQDIQWVNLFDDWSRGLEQIIDVLGLPEAKTDPNGSSADTEITIFNKGGVSAEERLNHQSVQRPASATDQSRSLLEAAQLSERYGDLERARDLVRRVSELAPSNSNADILLRCAQLSERYGDLERARDLVRRVSEIR